MLNRCVISSVLDLYITTTEFKRSRIQNEAPYPEQAVGSQVEDPPLGPPSVHLWSVQPAESSWNRGTRKFCQAAVGPLRWPVLSPEPTAVFPPKTWFTMEWVVTRTTEHLGEMEWTDWKWRGTSHPEVKTKMNQRVQLSVRLSTKAFSLCHVLLVLSHFITTSAETSGPFGVSPGGPELWEQCPLAVNLCFPAGGEDQQHANLLLPQAAGVQTLASLRDSSLHCYCEPLLAEAPPPSCDLDIGQLNI